MSKFADIQIDTAIIRRAARGDARAHEMLYRAFATPVYSVCACASPGCPAHAEDLVQETFIEVMRSIRQFRGEAAIGSWIRRIAVTKSLMFLRSAWTSRSQSLADDFDDMTPRRCRESRRIETSRTMRWISIRRWPTCHR